MEAKEKSEVVLVMEAKRKPFKRLIAIITLLILLLIFCGLVIYLSSTQENLIQEIRERDKLIELIKKRDSSQNKLTDSAASIITKYTRDSVFVIDGKEVSFAYISNLVSNLQDEKLDLLKQLVDCSGKKNISDSLRIETLKDLIEYKKKYDTARYNSVLNKYIQDRYGIIAYIKYEGSKRSITSSFSRADSAMLLYKYFADRIRRDSTSSTRWIIKQCPD